jgi:hypothetical protein
MPQQRCLQTSCCVVQLSAQALEVLAAPVAAPPGAAELAAAAAVVGTQEFWQVIASVSQLI